MESAIQVGISGKTVWIRVEGKGSFLNSRSMKEFTRAMINRGYREFVFDLEHCIMMDSTFMGTMAGVSLRLKELGQGRLHVVHCQARSRDLLSGLGLDQIFEIHSDGETAPACELLNGVAAATTDKAETTRTMFDAHEALCAATPENFTRFKDVLDYLKQDLHEEAVAH